MSSLPLSPWYSIKRWTPRKWFTESFVLECFPSFFHPKTSAIFYRPYSWPRIICCGPGDVPNMNEFTKCIWMFWYIIKKICYFVMTSQYLFLEHLSIVKIRYIFRELQNNQHPCKTLTLSLRLFLQGTWSEVFHGLRAMRVITAWTDVCVARGVTPFSWVSLVGN